MTRATLSLQIMGLGVKYEIELGFVQVELIAAVRVKVPLEGIAQAWKPALDEVWAVLRSNRELRPGHNLFLYHHPDDRNEAMDIDFGVQVAHAFDQMGNVRCVETPKGKVARTVHIGPYDRLGEAHNAIHTWCAANNQKIGKASWEIYGDWNSDPAKLETTILYLLT